MKRIPVSQDEWEEGWNFYPRDLPYAKEEGCNFYGFTYDIAQKWVENYTLKEFLTMLRDGPKGGYSKRSVLRAWVWYFKRRVIPIQNSYEKWIEKLSI